MNYRVSFRPWQLRLQPRSFASTATGNRPIAVAGCIFALLLALSLAPRLTAQTNGEIDGHVSDSTGAVIPDANITLTNVGTGAARTTLTTSAGDYTFTAVPPAVYNLQAAHEGFKVESARNVAVQVQQSVRQDFKLQVGAVTQSITVSATGDLLQVENATIGTVVENEAVNQLPLNGRNYLSLVALSSNANTLSPASGQAGSRMGGDRASQSISVGGERIMFDYPVPKTVLDMVWLDEEKEFQELEACVESANTLYPDTEAQPA